MTLTADRDETVKALQDELKRYRRPRFHAGFKDGAKCGWTDVFSPGAVPIIDTHSGFMFGAAMAFAENESAAKQIVDALNLAEGVNRAMGVRS